MKHPFRSSILPFFTMGAGGIGFCLRLWLFSATDEKGLLPTGHAADAALYILAAAVIGVLFLSTRRLSAVRINRKPVRIASVCAYILGALALFFLAATKFYHSTARLATVATIACLLGGAVMVLMAVLKLLRKKLPFWTAALLTVVFIVVAVAQCQKWGSMPQLQTYFFPLLASIFLMLTAYQKTMLLAGQGRRNRLAFFSQCALFFCCLSLNSDLWPLYLGMLFWSAVQICPCIRIKKEA